jgi:hypothetical protein
MGFDLIVGGVDVRSAILRAELAGRARPCVDDRGTIGASGICQGAPHAPHASCTAGCRAAGSRRSSDPTRPAAPGARPGRTTSSARAAYSPTGRGRPAAARCAAAATGADRGAATARGTGIARFFELLGARTGHGREAYADDDGNTDATGHRHSSLSWLVVSR